MRDQNWTPKPQKWTSQWSCFVSLLSRITENNFEIFKSEIVARANMISRTKFTGPIHSVEFTVWKLCEQRTQIQKSKLFKLQSLSAPKYCTLRDVWQKFGNTDNTLLSSWVIWNIQTRCPSCNRYLTIIHNLYHLVTHKREDNHNYSHLCMPTHLTHS